MDVLRAGFNFLTRGNTNDSLRSMPTILNKRVSKGKSLYFSNERKNGSFKLFVISEYEVVY